MKTLSNINWLLALIVTALLAFVSCENEEETLPPSITLSEDVISLVAGTEYTLNATVTPSVTSSEVVWLSNKTHVATVNGGIVKALDEGKAKIVAKIGNISAICEVIVTKVAVPVTGISLNKTELEMKIGDGEKLIAEIEPYEATDRRVTWSSSNENVVSVHESSGTLMAHAIGEAVITVKTLDGDYTATCTVEVVGTIELLAPSDNSNFTLHPIDGEKKVTFSWSNIEEIDEYIIKISTSDLFEEENVILSYVTTETKLDITEYLLNEAIKGLEGNPVSLYWTVVSGTSGVRMLPEIRRLNLTSDRREYLRLSEESSSGIQLQKKAGEYQYLLIMNGQASINTVALTNDVPSDSGVVSMHYKSNKALPSLTINFIKQDGTITGSLEQDVAQSSEWKQLRFEQYELPGGWGSIGDYIQLDFGNVSDYQIELDAIHLQKGVYVSEILWIEEGSYNPDMQVIEHGDNYLKFKVVARDPVAYTLPFTQALPAKATLLSFEYKSDMDMKNYIEFFLAPLDFSNLISQRFDPVPKNDTGQWKVHVIDMTDMRARDPEWGITGDLLRFDFGDDASIGMTFEIRNIHFKIKD